MTAATTARIADAIIETIFAEHELPLEDEIYQKYLVTARAAIEAIEPSEAMVDAGKHILINADSKTVERAFRAMIAAAIATP